MHVNTLKFYNYSPVKKPEFKDKFCYQPFNRLQIDEDGDVMLCGCQQDMPYVIGNIYTDTLENIWNSAEANRVRQSVIDGEFTYCSRDCSHLAQLPDRPDVMPAATDFPLTIKLDLDRSCNLKCPSCREQIIIEKHSQKIDTQIKLFEEIKQRALNNPDKQFRIIPMASGEIFASHSGRAFLTSLIDYPFTNLRLDLISNGTLFIKNAELINSIKHLMSKLAVSIDAATPETYAKVRGGNWNELLAGLELFKNTSSISLNLIFCVQKSNFHEIELFAELAKKYNASVSYQKMTNWGHWNVQWWEDNKIFNSTENKSEVDQVLDSLAWVKKNHPYAVGVPGEVITYLKNTP